MRVAFVPADRHLLRAKDLADARYFEPLDVDDLARAAGLSRAHFSREFRRAFGESPHAYLLTRRLERAAALLRTTDRSVADSASRSGSRASARSRPASRARTASRRPPTAPGSRRPPTGRWSRPAWSAPTAGPSAARFEKTTVPHAVSVVRRSSPRRPGGQDDQALDRAALGPRPGRGARVLHQEAGHGGSLPMSRSRRWATSAG